MMERYFKPSVDAPMESAEDGDYVFFTDMQAALAAKDQQVQAWQMAYEGVQRQLAEQDQLIKELEEHEHKTHERLGKILGTDDSLEECARRLRGELQYAKQTAVQDFIHGRSKLCLICGAKEPCVLKDDPSSPCTFDPTPIELLEYNRKLRELLAAKDQELARVKDELAAKIRSKNDCVIDLYRKLDKLDDLNLSLKQQLDTLLGEAVQLANDVIHCSFDPNRTNNAQAFLARPDVQALEKGTPPCE